MLYLAMLTDVQCGHSHFHVKLLIDDFELKELWRN